MTNIRNYIAQGARRRGLDPMAVLAIASVEGGFGGAIGDQGTSYGPFQLHQGGALPRGRGNQWANSPQGLNYALDHIARVARGKHGRQAIEAIVRLFERPANPDAEVQKAFGRYGKVGGEAVPVAAPAYAAGGTAPDNTAALIQLLSQRQPDVTQIAGLLADQKAQPPAFHPSRMRETDMPRRSGGKGINELFYDPLGGIKHGQSTGAIGGHKDHVHVSLASEGAQREALAHARQLGLHVGEESNADVHPVHAKNSYHYRHYSNGLRQAADVSGDPRAMASFYRWVANRYGGH